MARPLPQDRRDEEGTADRVAYSEAFFRDDAAFVAALRERQPAAIAVLFDRHAAHVERLLVRLLGFHVDRSDLVHEVFVQVLRSISSFRGEIGSLKPWLNRVTVHVARHAIRRSRWRRLVRVTDPTELPEVEDPGAPPETVEALRRAWAVLESLPVDERTAFALRVVEQMPLAEVADACSTSLATCKRRVAKARARFKRRASGDVILKRWLEGRGEG